MPLSDSVHGKFTEHTRQAQSAKLTQVVLTIV